MGFISSSQLKEVEQTLVNNLKNGTLPVRALTTQQIEPVSEESGTIQSNPFISQGTGTNNNVDSVDTSPVAKQLEKQGYTVANNQLFEITGSHGYTRTGATTSVNYSNNYRKATITFTGDQTTLLQIYQYNFQ